MGDDDGAAGSEQWREAGDQFGAVLGSHLEAVLVHDGDHLHVSVGQAQQVEILADLGGIVKDSSGALGVGLLDGAAGGEDVGSLHGAVVSGSDQMQLLRYRTAACRFYEGGVAPDPLAAERSRGKANRPAIPNTIGIRASFPACEKRPRCTRIP